MQHFWALITVLTISYAIKSLVLISNYDSDCRPLIERYISIGSEVEVIPDLLLSGAFAHVNAMMIEWHARLAKSSDRKKLSNDLQVQY